MDTTFEVSFLKMRPDAKIYVFELKSSQMVPESDRHPNITYVNCGLGYDARLNMKPLADLMKSFGHTYIDVLKMDIEEAEYAFLDNESTLLQRTGQLLIEMHKYVDRYDDFFFILARLGLSSRKQRPYDAFKYIDLIEKQDMRLFSKEHNFKYGRYYFIDMLFSIHNLLLLVDAVPS
jgi:hypothetical protein